MSPTGTCWYHSTASVAAAPTSSLARNSAWMRERTSATLSQRVGTTAPSAVRPRSHPWAAAATVASGKAAASSGSSSFMTGARRTSGAASQSSGTSAGVMALANCPQPSVRPPAGSAPCVKTVVRRLGTLTISIGGGTRSSGKSSPWLVRIPADAPSRCAVTAA